MSRGWQGGGALAFGAVHGGPAGHDQGASSGDMIRGYAMSRECRSGSEPWPEGKATDKQRNTIRKPNKETS
jgi:hypothetical protein